VELKNNYRRRKFMPSLHLRFPNGRTKALTLSYDDGVEQDKQLIEIMNKYGLKGTFNLNSGLYAEEGTVYPKGQIHRRMTKKQILETFTDSGQEVAVHTLTHPFLEQLPVHRIVEEVMKDRENLEASFGTIVRGMAYPFGTYSDTVVEALKACGIVYSRTVTSTNDFRLPTDWLRLTATCHHNSQQLESLTKRFLEDKVFGAPYLFYLWGHSYEFEADNNWKVIEDFASYVGNREDIWYATNMEIYEYINAYNLLIFSTNGRLVKNPTDKKLWFECSGKTIEIEAGTFIEI
jgi:peptidoglycan/xylan/chitin deacetylase (PgdA/CDA1 family)